MKHIEQNLIIELGSKNTLNNIVSEYECVAEVLGYELFMKIFIDLIGRTCKMYNIYDDNALDFAAYVKFRLGLPTEEE